MTTPTSAQIRLLDNGLVAEVCVGSYRRKVGLTSQNCYSMLLALLQHDPDRETPDHIVDYQAERAKRGFSPRVLGGIRPYSVKRQPRRTIINGEDLGL